MNLLHTQQEKILKMALKILDANNVKYAILFDDGTKVGNLEIAKPKIRTVKDPYGRGTVRAYLLPLIQPLEDGETIKVSSPNYSLPWLSSHASKICCDLFGKGNYQVKTKKDHVLILRADNLKLISKIDFDAAMMPGFDVRKALANLTLNLDDPTTF
jgi:hypothetical protein